MRTNLTKITRTALLAGCLLSLVRCTSKHETETSAPAAVRQVASVDVGAAATLAAQWPEVGILIHSESDTAWSQCTVTLIDPHTVLSAAHCVSSNGSGIYSAGSLWVSFDYAEPLQGEHPLNNVSVDYIAVQQVLLPPNGADIAILVLAEDQNLPTLPLWRGEGGVFASGAPASVAGYGEDGNGGIGKKLAGTVALGSISDESISVTRGPDGAIPCIGDSGGPLVVTSNESSFLMGVLSSIDNSQCSLVTQANFTNSDSADTLAWIEQTLLQVDMPPGGCSASQDTSFNETIAGCMHSASGLVLSGMAPRELSLTKARGYCRSLVEGTYAGWRLPSADELTLAASASKQNLRVGQQDAYWADSPTDASGFNLAVRFLDGAQQPALGAEPHVVLCVRDGTK